MTHLYAVYIFQMIRTTIDLIELSQNWKLLLDQLRQFVCIICILAVDLVITEHR